MEIMVVSLSLVMGILLGAQPDETPPGPAQSTKVAVIDLKKVLENNEWAERIKKDIEKQLEPYSEKAEALRDEIEELRRDPEANKKCIRRKNAELAALGKEVRKQLGEKYQKDMAEVRKLVDVCATRVAEAYGYSIVLAHGSPEDPFERLNPSRAKSQPVSNGGLAPLYVHASADITNAVIVTLRPSPHLRQRNPNSDGGQSKPRESKP